MISSNSVSKFWRQLNRRMCLHQALTYRQYANSEIAAGRLSDAKFYLDVSQRHLDAARSIPKED